MCMHPPTDEDNDAPDFAQVMGDISQALEAYGFDIKKAQDEHSAKTWWSFVNTKSDELSKVATEYGPQEISYFRTLVSASSQTRAPLQPPRVDLHHHLRRALHTLSDQAHCKERQKIHRRSQ